MIDNLRNILRGVLVDDSAIDERLLLPKASYPVWMAIFYNVFINASNAMLDSDKKQMSCYPSGRAAVEEFGFKIRVWALIWSKPKIFSSHSSEAWRSLMNAEL